MESVSELDEDDPDVVHHRQEKLSKVLNLLLFLRGELDLTQLGHAIDQVGDVFSKKFLNPLPSCQGIFDYIVKQAHRDTHNIQVHVGQNGGNLNRM